MAKGSSVSPVPSSAPPAPVAELSPSLTLERFACLSRNGGDIEPHLALRSGRKWSKPVKRLSVSDGVTRSKLRLGARDAPRLPRGSSSSVSAYYESGCGSRLSALKGVAGILHFWGPGEFVVSVLTLERLSHFSFERLHCWSSRSSFGRRRALTLERFIASDLQKGVPGRCWRL